MTKVSVIIPVYNVERWLGEALDSVLAQTLRDIEIICINDGSIDNSATILERYHHIDHRIKVITQENQGLSCARNAGLAVAVGEYIYFMDSDDKLDLRALDMLYRIAHRDSLDILYFDGSSFWDDGYTPDNAYLPPYSRGKAYSSVLTGPQLALKMIQHHEYYSSVCLIFLNREFIVTNRLTFFPKILHEDNLFSFRSFMAAKRVSHINEVLFFRRVRSESIMTQQQRPENLTGYLITYIEIVKFMLSKPLNEVEQQAAKLTITSMFNAIVRVYSALTPEVRSTISWSDYPMAGRLFKQTFANLWGMYIPDDTADRADLTSEIEKEIKKELDQIRVIRKGILCSKSYYLGLAVTWIPRMLRKASQSIEQDGISVTLYKVYRKVRGFFGFHPRESQREREEKLERSMKMTIKQLEDEFVEKEENLIRQNKELQKELLDIREFLQTDYSMQISDISKALAGLRKQINHIKKELSQYEKQATTTHTQLNVTNDSRLTALSNRLSSTQSTLQFDIHYHYRKGLTREQYPDALKEWFYMRTGEKLNLENPKTYNEKIQWFKLNAITPQITRLSDKYLVREWVREKIGEKYLIPLLGVWDKPEDIQFDLLPEQFVLKANHGCGFNIIVTDKTDLDRSKTIQRMKRWMDIDYAFYGGFEMQYQKISRKILAEKYIENVDSELFDYKIWCFNGRVEYIAFLSNRANEVNMSFYDREWNLLPIARDYKRHLSSVTKPVNLDEMISIAAKLSNGFAHVRVDLYRLNNGQLYFGEMTFSPSSGASKWDPPEYNLVIGNMLHYSGMPEEGEGEKHEEG